MVSSSRPRTPSAGSSPPSDKLAAIPERSQQRKSSFGHLLRRSKSTDKKLQREQEILRQQREAAAAIPKSPPKLPNLYGGAAPPSIPSFGGEDRTVADPKGYQGRSSMDPSHSSLATGSVPIPPIPSSGGRNGDWVDPYARTESMTHRGRYSYASSAVSTINSPRRVRRRKDPTPFK